MKRYQAMHGLLAKRPVNLAPGGMVPISGANPYGPNASDPANITNTLVSNPAAGNVGLDVPEGMGPGGQQFQGNAGVGTIAPALGVGAAQGIGQQAALSNMLMQQAQGQGPNPAQMMLNQATGKNAANTAALMASQRGAAANPALIARQAALAGAGLQQQAAGQAATLGAEQQLAAQGQLQNLSAQQVAAQQAANQQNIAIQNSINSANASLAGGLQQSRAGLLGGAMQGAGAAQAVQSQGSGGGSSGMDDATYQKNLASDSGGIYAEGGMIGPRSLVGMHLAKMAQGGIVPAKVSPGEIYLPPQQAKAVAKGHMSPMDGEKIPGKAKVKGDSVKNDVVKKNLKEGGVVVPRTKADDSSKAAAFVRAVMSKNKLR